MSNAMFMNDQLYTFSSDTWYEQWWYLSDFKL